MRRSPIQTCSLHNYTGTQRCPLCSGPLAGLAAENERLRSIVREAMAECGTSSTSPTTSGPRSPDTDLTTVSKAPEVCLYCDGTGKSDAGGECGFCDGGKPLDTQADWDQSWGRVGGLQEWILVVGDENDRERNANG